MVDTLGSRIKRYEKVYDQTLTPRSCLFIRVDGKAFHTYTKGAVKPFDQDIIDAMVEAATKTSREMQMFKAAYIQSDECTFMLTDFDNLETQGWFGYELNKVVSVTASMFTAFFNHAIAYTGFGSNPGLPCAFFDARAFVAPTDDAPNVFLWRQIDWERNSVQMLSRSLYSHKELEGKKRKDMLELCKAKGADWENLPDQLKYGTYIFNGFGEDQHRSYDYDGLRQRLFKDIES
jgi:tRNA(His) guanylyltransferase